MEAEVVVDLSFFLEVEGVGQSPFFWPTTRQKITKIFFYTLQELALFRRMENHTSFLSPKGRRVIPLIY